MILAKQFSYLGSRPETFQNPKIIFFNSHLVVIEHCGPDERDSRLQT